MRIEAWAHLFDQLIQPTRSGWAEWRRSSASDDDFVLSQKSGSVVVREMTGPNVAGRTYRVTLLDSDGKDLDTITLEPDTITGDLDAETAGISLSRLVQEIRLQGDQAERVAKAIVNELNPY